MAFSTHIMLTAVNQPHYHVIGRKLLVLKEID